MAYIPRWAKPCVLKWENVREVQGWRRFRVKTLGGIGSILVFIPFVSLVGYILVIVAVKDISDDLQDKKIFDNVLIAAVTGIVVVAIAGASVWSSGRSGPSLASGSSWTPTRTGLMAPRSEAQVCTSCGGGSSRMSASADMFCVNCGAREQGTSRDGVDGVVRGCLRARWSWLTW